MKLDNGSSTAARYASELSDMLLPVPLGDRLDSTMYRIFATSGSYLGNLPSAKRHLERNRFFKFGECVRTMYNTLRRSGEHGEMNHIMRKAFLRMRYILFESFSDQLEVAFRVRLDFRRFKMQQEQSSMITLRMT